MSKYRCPECGSHKVLVYEKTSFWVNSGEYFCNSVKMHDSDAEVQCNDYGSGCDWTGTRDQLVGGPNE